MLCDDFIQIIIPMSPQPLSLTPFINRTYVNCILFKFVPSINSGLLSFLANQGSMCSSPTASCKQVMKQISVRIRMKTFDEKLNIVCEIFENLTSSEQVETIKALLIKCQVRIKSILWSKTESTFLQIILSVWAGSAKIVCPSLL